MRGRGRGTLVRRVAEWVADLPEDAATALGTDRRCPSESAIRRLLGRIDADAFDAVIGRFVQRLCAQRKPGGRRRVLAVDGKTLRGSRHHTGDGQVPGRHLLAVIDQHTRVALAQLAVDDKTNELIGRCAAPGRAENFVVTGRVDTA